MRGPLVAIEGIDRAGKSSVLKLLPALLADCGLPVVATGELHSPLATLIRQELVTLSPTMKAYLFAADRAWTLELEAGPALNAGSLVIWDRYVASALVYRTVEARISDGALMQLAQDINRPFPDPDLTLWIEVSVEISIARGEEEGNHVYSADFLRAVAEEYGKRATDRTWVRLDGEGQPEGVAERAAEAIRRMLEGFLSV